MVRFCDLENGSTAEYAQPRSALLASAISRYLQDAGETQEGVQLLLPGGKEVTPRDSPASLSLLPGQVIFCHPHGVSGWAHHCLIEGTC